MMITLSRIPILIVFLLSLTVHGQEYLIPLYHRTIPNSKPLSVREQIDKKELIIIRHVQNPDLAVYLPTKMYATGQCVIICPGGGYWQLSYDLEGTDIARYFNSIGIAGVVLKYRLPSSDYCMEPHQAPLMDAQRAMRLVRYHAVQWNIDPGKIGIMGFSAGGHLASTLATHFDYGNLASTDSVERQSCRPDFMILMYPVISFADSITHKGSKRLLIGEKPSNNLICYYSNELQVKDDAPPAFLVHADNDDVVLVENTLLMYQALRQHKIPAELHILSEGGHGFGLAVNNEHVASWTHSLKWWLNALNTMKK